MRRFVLLLAVATSTSLCPQTPVQGTGASFPSKVYGRWTEAFTRSSGLVVQYKPSGSGDGIKQITDRAVQFSGTDSPLSAEELDKRKLVQIPMVVGGVVPVVNLPGVGAGQLVLDGKVLGDLMSGAITQWKDKRIEALNPKVTLPALPVRRVVRSDRSGTTEGFSTYLAEVSEGFRAAVKPGQLPNWPGTVEAAQGNDGVVRSLRQSIGALSYVSFDRARDEQLSMVRLVNAEGQAVAASETSFRAAIINSDLHRKGDDAATLLNRSGANSWPITLATFVLVDAAPPTSVDTAATLKFLYWAFLQGDRLTNGTGFAPLPIAMQAKLASRFSQVRPRDGSRPDYLVR
jgi:phosphate transport system substrate-binding protein